jgi:hypothetical protein
VSHTAYEVKLTQSRYWSEHRKVWDQYLRAEDEIIKVGLPDAPVGFDPNSMKNWETRYYAALEARDAKQKAIESERDAKDEAIKSECDKNIAQIQRSGAYITLAIRIIAGLGGLAGVIMVSYWLGTGGTRPRDFRLD